MRCINPLKCGEDHFGERTYSSKKHNKEIAILEFECRKCLPCRLNNAREKAVRCWHESKMHEDSIFLTLTYNEESLESPRLIYSHFQNFMKKLRFREDKKIPLMVTGEYGEINKRPHWHALLFNFRPTDQELLRNTELGHSVYKSESLTKMWGQGSTEYGDITIDSANYVARYAAKKLVHGRDQDHDYHPIHKTSSKYGLGRSWIEKNWKHTFLNGFVVLPDGTPSKIPRYYVDWAKKHHPSIWEHYVTEVRPKIMELAEEKFRKEELEFLSNLMNYESKYPQTFPLRKNQVKETILKSKFKQLQERLKL